jgi:WD40 repeat protein
MSILDLSFNEDTTCLVAGLNNGFVIYSLRPSIEKSIVTELNGGIGKARLLRSTNILGLVGGGEEPFRAKDTVIIWNQDKKKKAVGIELNEPIKNLYVTNKKIVIVVETRVCIAALNNGDIGHTKNTYNNERGLCKYSNKNDSLVVVTLGTKKGEVSVWSLTSDKHTTIQAHQYNIVALAINEDGSMIATASESGTNIHVYSTETGDLKYKLRRGTTLISSPTEIYDICFDKNSKQLACVSNSGTVHIWDLTTNDETSTNKKSTFESIGGVIQYFDSVWSREQITIGDTSKMICSFDADDVLHIATYNDNYFRISGKDGKYDQVKRSAMYTAQK